MASLPTDGLDGVAVGSRRVHRGAAAGLRAGIRPRRARPTGLRWALKRVMDVVAAALLLVALAPVLLLCAAAVRLSSPGPVLFRQHRVGRDGRVFSMWKLRSMTVDAEERLASLRSLNEADGPLFKLRHDPRVTRVGRWLRTWSLDELPQLVNVLRGEMSLVGPRPLPTYEVDLDDPWARSRLRVRPGVTGLWQVSGRHRLSFDEMVRYDLSYIDSWSLATDLRLIARTLPAVLRGSGV